MLGLGQDPTEGPTTALGVLVFGWAEFKQKTQLQAQHPLNCAQ
jgi:hypothetical protein